MQPDETTLARLKEYAGHMHTQVEAAAFFAVDEGTFIAFLQRYKEARQAWNMGKALGKASIRRLQLVHAKRNAGMSKWLGIVYLDQKEVFHTHMGGISGQPPIGIEHTAGRGLSALVESAHRESEKRAAAKLLPPQAAALPAPIELQTAPMDGTPAHAEALGRPEPMAAPTLPSAPPPAASDATLAAIEETMADPPRPNPPPPAGKAGAHAPKPKPPAAPNPPPHPAQALMGGGRINSAEFIESAGVPRAVPSDEAIYAEAVRRGLAGAGGQVSMADMARLRVEMAGEPHKPTYQEVCENAGAVMRRRPLFRR